MNEKSYQTLSRAGMSAFGYSYFLPAILLIVMGIFAVSGVSAQPAPGSPLGVALNFDGSLKASTVGTFDPAGYTMAKSPDGGPRFVADGKTVESSCGDSWDTDFSTSGTNGDVEVIASDGAGNIYVGGRFTMIGGIPASGIAKWNGSAWSALGAGLPAFSDVFTIAVVGTDVYVGGSFLVAGSRNVAKFDGSTWSGLGAGLGGGTHVVRSIVSYAGEVYIGGNFNTADGSPANGIVRWNGTAFNTVGTGTPMSSVLVVNSGNLYSGYEAGGVMKWDGSAWTNVGSSNGSVRDIVFRGTELWAVGQITYPGGASQIAKFNGTTWSHVATFNQSTPFTVAFLGTDVFIGGNWTRNGGLNITDGIFRYDGTNFTEVGLGTQGNNHRVQKLLTVGNKIYVGGSFVRAGGIGAANIAVLTDGTTWSSFPGTGVDGNVSAIVSSGSDVYVGGSFIAAGPVAANRIAKWNGTTNTWSALGTGIYYRFSDDFTVSAIAVSGSKVYAGGSFSNVNGNFNAANIAVWNGTAWSALGTGVNGRVTAMVAKGDDIYVLGEFSSAGGVAASRFAKWNGVTNTWSGLGSPLIPGSASSLAVVGNDIYIGSYYTTIDNPNNLLKYDGTNFTPLAGGMTGGGVDSMTAVGNNIYVSGGFSSIGSVPASRIARWDGAAWNAVPNNLLVNTNPRVASAGADLILFGDFTSINGVGANGIARWDGTNWFSMGSGLGGGRGAKAIGVGGNIYVTGNFLTAGCHTSPYFARYRRTVWTGTSGSDWHTAANWSDGAIPPAGAGVTIGAGDSSIMSADVTVSTLAVANNRTLTIGAGRTVTVTGDLDLRDGFVTGPGTLVVHGDAFLNGGAISNLASLNVGRSVSVTAGNITAVGAVTVGRDLTMNGNISGVTSLTVNRDFNQTGNISGTGTIAVLNDMSVGGAISNGAIAVTRHLTMNGGSISNAASISVGGNLAMNFGNISGPGMVTMTACGAASLSGGSPTSYLTSPLTRCVSGAGTFRFPVSFGSSFGYVEVLNVAGSGTLTIEAKSGAFPGAPSGLSANRLQRWWSTSATGITKADVSLNYLDADVVGNEEYYRGFGISGGAATRIQTTAQATLNRATLIGVTSFAAFTLAEADSVNALMNGRLIARGRGADLVEITMTDSFGNIYRTKTNQMGFFHIDTPLPTIRNYTFAFKSKRYQLATRAVVFDGDPLLTIVGP